MIEGGVILLIFFIAALIYVTARVQAANDNHHPSAERTRLEESLAWHESRLEHAQANRWDEQMIGSITEQLGETRRQLARLDAPPRGKRRA